MTEYVIVQRPEDPIGVYYRARIVKHRKDTNFVKALVYIDKKTYTIHTEFVFKLCETSEFKNGDHVMCAVNDQHNFEMFVPGVINECVCTHGFKYYFILYFNGQCGTNTEHELVKITKRKYGLIVDNILKHIGLRSNIIFQIHKEFKKFEWKHLEECVQKLLDKRHKKMIDKSIQNEIEKYEKATTPVIKQIVVEPLPPAQLKTLGPYVQILNPNLVTETLPYRPSSKLVRRASQPPSSASLYSHYRLKTPPLPSNQPQRSSSSSSIISIEKQIKQLRRSLKSLNVGDKVISKSTNNLLYYEGTVKQISGKYKYLIENNKNQFEEAYREDIIPINDDTLQIEINDPVIALHSFGHYAPGVVIKIANNLTMLVRFHDCLQTPVAKENAFKIPLFKFEYDVDMIIKHEKHWVNKNVVAHNPFSHNHESGKIADRMGYNEQFVINWPDNTYTVERKSEIFGKYTPKHEINVNDYVLSSASGSHMPGRVLEKSGNYLNIEFMDGKRISNVKEENCYWLSKESYEKAYKTFKPQIDQTNSQDQPKQATTATAATT